MKYREKKSTDLCIEEYFVMWPFRASLERPDSDLYGICACRGRASQWYGPSLLRPRFLLKKCDDGVTHFLRPASAQLLQPAEVGSNWVHESMPEKSSFEEFMDDNFECIDLTFWLHKCHILSIKSLFEGKKHVCSVAPWQLFCCRAIRR